MKIIARGIPEKKQMAKVAEKSDIESSFKMNQMMK